MSEKTKKRPYVSIEKIYIKDVSFESPYAPESFLLENYSPHIDLEINTEWRIVHREENKKTVETVLNIAAKAEQDDKVIYLVEVEQAGIFVVTDMQDSELATFAGIFCPSTLFPYASALIASLIEKGGYPQMLLQPINFEAIYQQNMQQKEDRDNIKH